MQDKQVHHGANVGGNPEQDDLRVLIADDHALLRDTLSLFLSAQGKSNVTAVDDFDAAFDAVSDAQAFDLILLDFHMPGMNGLDGLIRIKSVCGACPVAILSGIATPVIAKDAIAAGAAGFVPKTLGAASTVSAIRFMAAGETYVPYDFMNQIDLRPAHDLTDREIEVLTGICEGKQNKDIAGDLDLQEVTVKLHVKTLCRKLGARNRTQAAVIAKDRRLVSGPYGD